MDYYRNTREIQKYSYGSYRIHPIQIFRHPSKQTMFKNFPISEEVGAVTNNDCWKYLQNNTSDDDLMELICGFCKSNGERP